MTRRLFVAALSIALASSSVSAQRPVQLVADSGRFLLDGRPFQIISGEMHYARVPREYWHDRLRLARAMGLNTISTYVFWNYHESSPGKYDFSGQHDIAAFVRAAQEEGLHVILRPGPYVCAEWEWGGYPAWLLADSVVVRSTDPQFTAPAERWLDRLGKELTPLLLSHGGPIIAVQVENEYGSFDRDKAYLAWQLRALKHAGLDGALLYTADGDYQLRDGTLPELPAVVNFGIGEADSAFARLARFRPSGPLMSGEYWAGWFDQWGRAHQSTNVARQVSELTSMLGRGHSVNIYVFHGGTTFGFMNGANIDNGRYHPQTTSYDYDAALDESGRPTPKYFAFRDAIATTTGIAPSGIPAFEATMSVPSFQLANAGSLWDALGRPQRMDTPRSMETLPQSYGYILYRTTVHGPAHGTLAVHAVRDYAQVYVDGLFAGTIDRRLGQDTLVIDLPRAESRLDILVENSGRVNFGKGLRNERKGITKSVTLGGVALQDWNVYPLPMSETPRARTGATAPGPAFYRGTFVVSRAADTFLDMRGWGKGTVWVNGHQLGRFWGIGPQQTLYVPAPWINSGTNEVVVFDLEAPSALKMQGLSHAILDQLGVK